MTSLWLRERPPAGSDPLPDSCDVVVVGAGIAGLATALMLARAGRRVHVLEARTVGAGATGHSSAKLSVLQGTKLSRLRERHPRDVVSDYATANREALDWLLRFCGEQDVPVQRRADHTCALVPAEIGAARAEHRAAAEVGLPVTWTDAPDLPFRTHGATVLPDQGVLDPMDLVEALTAELRREGGTLTEAARVVRVSLVGRPRLVLETGEELACEHLVLATGTPLLDRGLFFAKLTTDRSYVIALDHPDPPEAMALSAGSPVVSVRDATTTTGRRVLLVGGHGHPTGRARTEAGHLDGLRQWAAATFPEADELAAWSAQDHRSWDGLPWAGPLPRGMGRIHAVTGFDKWGFTNGVAAAMVVAGRLTGASPSWAGPWTRLPVRPRDLASLAGINLAVAKELAAGLRTALVRADAEQRRPGPCPHLGGTLHWNDAEQTWDCPLHGSRFAADGCVLEGPATKPLKFRE